MNKKLLCAALLSGLGIGQAAQAQDFDDRWYITGAAGMNIQDNERGTRNTPFGALGFGKYFTPNWSFDTELNYQNPKRDHNQDLRWNQYGISFDFRYHFISEGRSWNPYLLMGLGYQREELEYDNFPLPNSPAKEKDGGGAAKVGVGLEGDVGRVKIRTELAYRASFSDKDATRRLEEQGVQGRSAIGDRSWFGDTLASVGVVIPLGPEPEAPVEPAPAPVQTCADMDSDGDGVNDCDDKCPDSQPGQTIGPDGCPVPVSIDLKGVNFDFDKATLRPDAVAILNEAVEILKRYPEMRVEVAGHTDLCGKDAYNQKLSERRAQTVYDYLVTNGIDASRLVGPVGYGESRPLVDTAQNLPECKNETNRRTELNSQS